MIVPRVEIFCRKSCRCLKIDSDDDDDSSHDDDDDDAGLKSELDSIKSASIEHFIWLHVVPVFEQKIKRL